MKLTRTTYIIGLIALNIALDQISKFIVRAYVTPYETTELLGDKFILTNVENSGAFLSLGSDLNPTLKSIFLLLLPIVVLGYITYYIISNKTLDRFAIFGFACIIGGGIANVYDRILYGSVTDFFHIDLGGIFKTGVFNVADMSVMLGMGLLLYSNFITSKKAKQTAHK
ncbi:signal peptidase II [Formosa sediminum]|uniref:Lipoprotein signal peptidase n=1 Tax=Formosa sediminum TaxID=2594004 RepID=A0A516GN08_9FLAO|nr:signal peptidase II [Formosa sediminum]QDO92889.1 signal peptidase II [Formosa sediminum]